MPIEDRLRDGFARNGAATTVEVEPALDAVRGRRRRTVRARWAASCAAAVVVAGAVVWGAGQLDREPPAPVTPPASSLVGTWAVDVPPEGGNLAGRWVVTIAADGDMVLDPPARAREYAVAHSNVEVTGDRLRSNAFVTDAPGCQLPGAAVGIYTWEVSGSLATFAAEEELCDPRRALFSAPWEAVR